MKVIAPATTPKKSINLSIDAELLRISKELNLNVSSIAEEALARAVKACLEEAWLKDNAGAIASYNARVEAGGVFSEGLRAF
jgi:antitoxin CcdA